MAQDPPPGSGGPPSEPAADEDEFAGIPDPPAPRGALVSAIAVLVLGALVLWRLAPDVRYAFSGGTPRDLGEARQLAPELEEDAFVAVRGQPDRRHALFLEPRGEKSRQTLFRLLGTDSRLFVRARDTSAPGSPLEERWVGRLRRFDASPWADTLRGYFATQVRAARYLSPEGLLQLVRGTEEVTRDRAGRPLTVARGATLAIDVVDPDTIEVLLARDQVATQDDAVREVEHLVLIARPGPGTGEAWGVWVPAPPPGRDVVLQQLEEKGFAFRLSQVRYLVPRDHVSVDTPAGQLTLTGAAIERTDGTKGAPPPGPVVVPVARVTAASVAEPVVVPKDAWILTEGEAPGSLWWAPLLAAIILAVAAFNAWYLLRGRRR